MLAVATRPKTFTIHRVRDVFKGDPSDVEVVEHEPLQGRSLRWYLPEDVDPVHRVITVNGTVLHPSKVARYKPREGDRVTVAEVPGVTAAFVAGVLSISATGFTAAAVAFVANIAIAAAINLAVSYAIQALTPSPSRRRPRPITDAREEDSPTQSFFGQQNTLGAGVVIPLVYGKVRTGGHIIESFQKP